MEKNLNYTIEKGKTRSYSSNICMDIEKEIDNFVDENKLSEKKWGILRKLTKDIKIEVRITDSEIDEESIEEQDDIPEDLVEDNEKDEE